MSKTIKSLGIIGIIGIIASLNGCASTWNLLQKKSLYEDISHVLKTNKLSNFECIMVGLSRVATCTFSDSPQVVNQIISDLSLEKYYPSKNSETSLLVTLDEGCELITPFNEFLKDDTLSPVILYQSPNDTLKIDYDIGNFECFQLYHHLQTNKSCIQVTYRSG